MAPQDTMSLNLAMNTPWYKEYWTFLMIPLFSTVACYFIPLFHCEQGLAYMSILPLMTAFSYAHLISPRRPYYEKDWKQVMTYRDFILANVKKTIIFAAPTCLLAWTTALFLNGFPKELAMFFETATWGLASGICIFSLFAYIDETFKLRKTNPESSKASLSKLWRWIVLPTLAFALLGISRGCIILNLLTGRA